MVNLKLKKKSNVFVHSLDNLPCYSTEDAQRPFEKEKCLKRASKRDFFLASGHELLADHWQSVKADALL